MAYERTQRSRHSAFRYIDRRFIVIDRDARQAFHCCFAFDWRSISLAVALASSARSARNNRFEFYVVQLIL